MTKRADLRCTTALGRVVAAYASAPPGFVPVPPRSPDAGTARTIGMQTVELRGPMDRETIEKRDADSAAMLEYWDLADTLIAGAQAVRDAGEKYLPRFSDEPKSRYDDRLKLTKFTNVYGDIIENLASKPFEQEITVATSDDKPAPEPIVQFAENVDGSGSNISVFGASVFYNGINNAVDWIFVDTTADTPREVPMTVAEAKARNIRPYWSRVLGRNVLAAKSKMIGAGETLTYIKIMEPGTPDRIREFERLDTGTIEWRLWEKQSDTSYRNVEAGTLSIDQIPFVPFATGRRDGKRFYWSPPMRSAADLQRELYQDESGLKYKKTLAAYSMLNGKGVKPEIDPVTKKPMPLVTGPGVVLYGPSDGNGTVGEWGYIEPSAEILKFLAEDIKETIAQLRELGRMPLTAQSGNLTVISAAAAAGKARSAVGSWAYALKDALENAMLITDKYLGIDKATYDPEINVYTEFDQFTDDKENDILSADRDRGDISRETLWEERKRRGILSSEFDADIEAQRLLDELPNDGPDTTIEGAM